MSRKNTLYYVNTDQGCGIFAAQSITQAKRKAKDDAGKGVKSVRRATSEDVDWVQAMGGFVPEGVALKPE